MVRGISAIRTGLNSDKNYINKALRFIEGSKAAFENGNWDSAAVHATISACDAVCARFLQKRHSGAEHTQAVELLNELPIERAELESKIKQAKRVVSQKNMAEYEDRAIKEDDAQEMLRDAERLVQWAESRVKT